MVAAAWVGPAISAAASLAGGLLGNKSASDRAKANVKFQKEFAKYGIQWKVADAKRAGIHPLYALGAQTHSFSPVAFDDPLPNALANAGQDIGRAIAAGTPKEQQPQVVDQLLRERGELQNDLLRSQIAQTNLETDAARLRFARDLLGPKTIAPPAGAGPTGAASPFFSGSVPPGAPTPPKSAVEYQPSKTTAHIPGQPGVEAAATPGFQWVNVGNGRWLMPNQTTAEVLEGMGAFGHIAGPLMWWQANWDARNLGNDAIGLWDRMRRNAETRIKPGQIWRDFTSPRRLYNGRPGPSRQSKGYTGYW